jgi:hypothetical protein
LEASSRKALGYLTHVDKVFLIALVLSVVRCVAPPSQFELVIADQGAAIFQDMKGSMFLSILMAGACVSVNDWAVVSRTLRSFIAGLVDLVKLFSVRKFARRVLQLFQWLSVHIKALTVRKIIVVTSVLGISAVAVSAYVAFINFLGKNMFAQVAVGIVGGCGALFVLVASTYSFYSEWKLVHSPLTSRFETRAAIHAAFTKLRNAYLRGLFVRSLEDYHRKAGTRPTGLWPLGAAPNLGDKASTRLAQLDEIWAGMER